LQPTTFNQLCGARLGIPAAHFPRFDEVGTPLMKSLRDLNLGILEGLHLEWPA